MDRKMTKSVEILLFQRWTFLVRKMTETVEILYPFPLVDEETQAF